MEYTQENGWTNSENFIRLLAESDTLMKIKKELDDIINFLESHRKD
jgi:hypothetical protein